MVVGLLAKKLKHKQTLNTMMVVGLAAKKAEKQANSLKSIFLLVCRNFDNMLGWVPLWVASPLQQAEIVEHLVLVFFVFLGDVEKPGIGGMHSHPSHMMWNTQEDM